MKAKLKLKLTGVAEMPQQAIGGTAYGHLRFHVDEIRDDGSNLSFGKIRNVLISSQIDGSKEQAQPSYAWEIGYKEYGVLTIYELKDACKILGPIAAKFEKLKARFGSPQTFGNFVVMAADAIGASQIILQPAERHGEPRTFWNNCHAIAPINAEVLRIWNECRKREGKEPVAA